ncbi:MULTISPECIES: hypothetical protein [Roseobacteraceae]|uniref:Uncharacterized protein n=1 Tax=Celeribacter baekdonensis B30 TaxID=1208323 RepID=K2JMN5_9RHOB|nr:MULTISPECIES: hypothetical protein [Roseobacteraceae]EKE71739.1 hypothetical protein B30_08223 [Celeribacter baekdonensis B30]KAB6715090.1 hypothetical protein C8029_16795 [Roseobacter sp. TSBP12]|tara:strand:+ start:14167 stop:14970 length:804 start_codon:yes stop_codon:yes gene_type:complete
MALAVVPVGFDLPDGPHLSELRKIGGRTLLEICLKELSDAGQTELVVLVGPHSGVEIGGYGAETGLHEVSIRHAIEAFGAEVSIAYASRLEQGISELSNRDILVVWPTDLWRDESPETVLTEAEMKDSVRSETNKQTCIRHVAELMAFLCHPVVVVENGVDWEISLHACAVERDASNHIVRILDPDICRAMPETLDIIRMVAGIPAGSFRKLRPDNTFVGWYGSQALFYHLLSDNGKIIAFSEEGKCYDARFESQFNAYLASSASKE